MNPGVTVQIEAPDFDLDIDGIFSSSTYEIPDKLLTQETASPAPKTTEPENERSTPATSTQQTTSQDTDWLDTIPVQNLFINRPARGSGNRQTPDPT